MSAAKRKPSRKTGSVRATRKTHVSSARASKKSSLRRRAKTAYRSPAGGTSASVLLARLVELARIEVGTRESGGNNRGARIEEYQQATWLPPGPWAWCAAFMAWLVREWTNDPQVRAYFGLANDSAVSRWRCRDSRAFGWEEWARSRGLRVVGPGYLARLGDIVVFDFPHIGLVTADQKTGKDPLRTIEGNTNAAGARDSQTGDGVWEKSRNVELAKSLIRLIE